MKVYLGPYTEWIGPYQIADIIFFWLEKYPNEELDQRWDYKLHDRFGKWLADTWVNDFCQWIYERKKRNVKIHIDNYDVWSADHTLSLITVPMLKKLKEIKHGSGWVDDEDVPEELRSSAAPPKQNEWDTDDNFHKRWDWVLDEMIWAHEQIIDEEDKYISDKEASEAYQARISNGLRLFGKYYQNLWD
jgi:hypothetical protein